MQIFFFDSPRVVVGEQPAIFGRRKSLAVLAYLALHPGTQSREKIAGIFWGDTSDEDARRSLRVILTELRKALGEEAIVGDRDTLRLNPALTAQLDTGRFADLLRHPATVSNANLDAALALYRGELLAGMDDEWILPLRQHFHAQWLRAALLRIERHCAEGDYAAAIQTARALLQREPAHEIAHQRLIFCLAASGERTAAMQQVEICRAALRQHLDADLSAETLALAESIRKQEAEGSAAGRLTNLPHPLTSFIGREAELEQIETLLTQTRLLTLTGPGGSGKTRLAIQAADEASHSYPGGVWWMDLASLAEPDLVAGAIARTLGVAERGGESLLALTASRIGGQRLLLALDTCEHLLVACAQAVQYLSGRCPGLAVLAASREPLDLPGEVAWETPPFPTPPEGSDLRTLRQNESIRLFVERARAANASFQLNAGNAAAVAGICRRLEGIPLAIELAAAQMDRRSLAEIDLGLSQAGGGTLRAAIQWSYDLLSPVQQMLFRRLAVFDGGWDLAAASIVAAGYAEPQTPLAAAAGPHGVSPLPISGEMVTRQVLENLARKGLAQARHAESGPRYSLLDALAEFAGQACQAAGEWERLAQSHACFYFALLDSQWSAAYSPREPAILDQIERETANLRRAWRWQAAAAEWQAPPQAISYQSRFWLVRGHYAESRLLLHALLAHPALADRHPARAELLNSLGLTEWQSGETGTAKTCFERALADYTALGLHRNAAMASINLGGVYVDEEDAANAERCLAQGLAWARESSHERALAIGLNNLAILMTDQGDYGRARLLLEECLALRRNLGDQRGVGITLNNLADVEAYEERFDVARRLYSESLDLRARLGDRRGALIPALNLARLLGQEGRWQTAAGLLGFAEETLAQLGIQLAADARRGQEEVSAAAQTALGPAAFERARQSGRTLTLSTVGAWLAAQT